MRRIGANRIVCSRTQVLTLGVVEISDCYLSNFYAIDGELPQTEWFGGTIILSSVKHADLPSCATMEQIINVLMFDDTFPKYAYHISSESSIKQIITKSEVTMLCE